MFIRSIEWVRVEAHDPDGMRQYTQDRTGSLPYANWFPGEPSTPSECGYIAIIYGGQWNDVDCDRIIPIVCEYDII